jgi:uncharacterized protein YxjI
METLTHKHTIVVQQKKEWGEILSGFEMRNKYLLSDEKGEECYFAGELPGSLMLRLFLKNLRPFEIVILRHPETIVLRLVRPFRFYFHRIEVFDGQRRLIGAIQRRFAIIRRIYSVLDSSDNEVLRLFGPILHPWTFNILKDEQEVGKITKRWSGLLKEAFTAADNFGMVVPKDLDLNLKALLLGAVFLIDFVHFEKRGNR